VGNHLVLATLETLLKCKIATLVSRASEKDLYDLLWLLDYFPKLSLDQFIQYGSQIDAGINQENLLLSLSGALLKQESCNFAIDPGITAKQIFKQIQSLRKKLIKQLADPRTVKIPPLLKEITQTIKKLS